MLEKRRFSFRKACGMESAMLPWKRRRRVCGMNVFLQQRMKSCGAKVGSESWRRLQSTCSLEWKAMSKDARENYERLAAEQESQRHNLSGISLATSDDSAVSAVSSLCPGVRFVLWLCQFLTMHCALLRCRLLSLVSRIPNNSE